MMTIDVFMQATDNPQCRVKAKRQCEVCHADCRRKKVWSTRGKRVICMACGSKGWRFDDNGQVVAPEVLR